jgi:hypothetical protein
MSESTLYPLGGASMPWRKLKRRSSIKSTKPAISIQKNGRIAWNQGTQNVLGNPTFVELLYDDVHRMLGVRAVSEENTESFPVYKSPKQNTWGIHAKGALDTVGVMVDKSFHKLATTDRDVVSISVEEIVGEPPGAQRRSRRKQGTDIGTDAAGQT